MRVVLNNKEKEQLVVKFHYEGRIIREIASAAHVCSHPQPLFLRVY